MKIKFWVAMLVFLAMVAILISFFLSQHLQKPSEFVPTPSMPTEENNVKIEATFTVDVMNVKIENNLLVWDETQLGEQILINNSNAVIPVITIPDYFACFDNLAKNPFHLALKTGDRLYPGGGITRAKANTTEKVPLVILASQRALREMRQLRNMFTEQYAGDGLPFIKRSQIQTLSIYVDKTKVIDTYIQPNCSNIDTNNMEKVKAIKLNITN